MSESCMFDWNPTTFVVHWAGSKYAGKMSVHLQYLERYGDIPGPHHSQHSKNVCLGEEVVNRAEH